jgi:hypothetical protein
MEPDLSQLYPQLTAAANRASNEADAHASDMDVVATVTYKRAIKM